VIRLLKLKNCFSGQVSDSKLFNNCPNNGFKKKYKPIMELEQWYSADNKKPGPLLRSGLFIV
jgi:hypothetical protein